MRILTVTPTFLPIVGGAELLIDDVLTSLSDQHRILLLTPELPECSRDFWVEQAHAAPKPYETRRFRDRISLLDLRGHRLTRGVIPPASLSAIAVLDRTIRRFEPDVLLTFFAVPYGLPSVLMKWRHRIDLVVVLCGTDIPSPRTAPVPAWRSYVRRITAAADRAVYVSSYCFRTLHDGEPDPAHDRIIHGGVDLQRLRPNDPGRVRRSLGLGPEDAMLFALSRLGPEKRVDYVIRAFARLRSEGRRARLVIAGQGSERESLEVLARRLGVADDVVFVGYLGDEKADYYAACDVFVFHSLFETFGQVVAEAMSFGKPVVSVRAGAIPEVVEDGVTGLLAEPRDPAGMADAVGALLDDAELRERLGRAGYEKARRCYAWESQAVAWAEALRVEKAARPRPREGAWDHASS